MVESSQAFEIISQRLYWISDKKPPKSRSSAFYFCIDNDLVYEPFFADFGPLDLGKVHLFCKELEKLKTKDITRQIRLLDDILYLADNDKTKRKKYRNERQLRSLFLSIYYQRQLDKKNAVN